MRDSTQALLIRALRELRRQPGQLSREQLAVVDLLVSFVGNGSADLAWSKLMAVRKRYGTDPESDIGAFFYLSGWKIGLETLDARKRWYSSHFACDERTALRRADHGIQKIAKLVREGFDFDRPSGIVAAYQDGMQVQVFITFIMRRADTFPTPRVYVSRRSWKVGKLAIDDDMPNESQIGRKVKLVGIPLVNSSEINQPLSGFEIIWTPVIWPYWDIATHCADSRVYWHTSVGRSGILEFSVRWFDETAIGDAELASTGQFERIRQQSDPWEIIDVAIGKDSRH